MAKKKTTESAEPTPVPAAETKAPAKRAKKAEAPAAVESAAPAQPAKAKSAKEAAPAVTTAKAPEKAAAAPAKPAAKAAAGKKSPHSTGETASGTAPLIDTNLAAQTAAAMLVNRATITAAAQGGSKPESATFKNMKEQLAKPKPAGLGLPGIVGGGKKSSGPSFLNAAKGHNQTYGGFNKTGVPRRTNG